MAPVVSPDGRWVYVSNIGGGTLSIIDAMRLTVVGESRSALRARRWVESFTHVEGSGEPYDAELEADQGALRLIVGDGKRFEDWLSAAGGFAGALVALTLAETTPNGTSDTHPPLSTRLDILFMITSMEAPSDPAGPIYHAELGRSSHPDPSGLLLQMFA